jgi:hypothetical protein
MLCLSLYSPVVVRVPPCTTTLHIIKKLVSPMLPIDIPTGVYHYFFNNEKEKGKHGIFSKPRP